MTPTYREQTRDLPLLGNVPPMTRRGDHRTSIDAAQRIREGHMSRLHRQVLDAFARLGPMTDETLEKLPEFAKCGPSTIRKRRSELYQADVLVIDGRDEAAKMNRWAIAPREPQQKAG